MLSFWSEMFEMLLCLVRLAPHCHFQAVCPPSSLKTPDSLKCTSLTSLSITVPCHSHVCMFKCLLLLHCVLTSWPRLFPCKSPPRMVVKGRESRIRLIWFKAWLYHLLALLCLLNYEMGVEIVPTL